MSAAPSDPYGFCEALARGEDRDGWLASLFAPSALRPHLHALDAFRIEIAQVRARVTQPLAGEIRLQWWRDALAGEARGGALANPVAAAVIDTIARHALPLDLFDEAIEAHRIALYGAPIETTAALERLFEATWGAFVRLASMVLAGPSGDLAAPARHAGVCLGLSALLRDFPAAAARGWAAMPADLLRRHGAGQAEVTTALATAAIDASLRELRALARSHLAALRTTHALVPEAAAPAYLRVALVEPVLRRLDRMGADPFAPVPDLPQWRRQWILWREARRGRLASP